MAADMSNPTSSSTSRTAQAVNSSSRSIFPFGKPHDLDLYPMTSKTLVAPGAHPCVGQTASAARTSRRAAAQTAAAYSTGRHEAISRGTHRRRTRRRPRPGIEDAQTIPAAGLGASEPRAPGPSKLCARPQTAKMEACLLLRRTVDDKAHGQVIHYHLEGWRRPVVVHFFRSLRLGARHTRRGATCRR
eukprot:scaffold6770_cov125-Isochrysis_galbana.AAC.5